MQAVIKYRLGRALRRVGVLPIRPAVLMYHRIATDLVDPWGLAVSARRFDEQLAWLTEHRLVLPLAEFAQLHRKARLPSPAVALTFDDGYACNATTAAPLLKAHRAHATVFVTSGPISEGLEFWWDDLQRITFDPSVDRLDLNTEGQRLSVELGDPAGGLQAWRPGAPPRNSRQLAFLKLWQVVRSLKPGEQGAVLAALRAQTGTAATPRESHRPMTPGELEALSHSAVIDVGCHTMTHPALPQRSVDVQRAEIADGRRACEVVTGRLPTTFAYPFGDYTRSTVELVREAGFEAACTTDTRGVTPSCDSLALPRLQVKDWSAQQLASQLGAL